MSFVSDTMPKHIMRYTFYLNFSQAFITFGSQDNANRAVDRVSSK